MSVEGQAGGTKKNVDSLPVRVSGAVGEAKGMTDRLQMCFCCHQMQCYGSYTCWVKSFIIVQSQGGGGYNIAGPFKTGGLPGTRGSVSDAISSPTDSKN